MAKLAQLPSIKRRYVETLMNQAVGNHHLPLWERSGPERDGLAYYDTEFAQRVSKLDFTKHSEIRRDVDSSTTTEDTPPDAKNEQSATDSHAESVIDFTNFGCNVIARHWVCSRTSAPFCVFFSVPVPAALRIYVSTVQKLPKLRSSESRLLALKCNQKLRVNFTKPAF